MPRLLGRTQTLLAVTALAGCSPPPPVEIPAPPDPVVAEPGHGSSGPLVLAVDEPTPLAPPESPASAACELPKSPGLPADCRAIFPLAVKASGARESAALAFDGSTCTTWNAGGFAPQAITVDLGAPTDIDALVLVPEMTPNGNVTHRLELSEDGKTFSSAHRIEAPMSSGQPVELVFPKRERTRFLRLSSDKSPSWIAWREIGLLRCGRTQR